MRDAVAAIGATSGAGGGDVYLEFYTGRDQRVHAFDPVSTVPQADQHAQVLALRVRDEQVEVDYVAYRGYPAAAFYRSARFAYSHGRWTRTLYKHTGATGQGL